MTCFDRVDETAEIWRQIKDHKNLLMLAPRRIGKTVLLNHLRDTAAHNGYRAVLLDVEGFREEKDFFRQCCATCVRHTPGCAGSIPARSVSTTAPGATGWKAR